MPTLQGQVCAVNKTSYGLLLPESSDFQPQPSRLPMSRALIVCCKTLERYGCYATLSYAHHLLGHLEMT